MSSKITRKPKRSRSFDSGRTTPKSLMLSGEKTSPRDTDPVHIADRRACAAGTA